MSDRLPVFLKRLQTRNFAIASVFILACAVVMIARTWFIARYGSSVPFEDQWGAEADLIYKPLLDGTFDWSTLWRSHNEHRILFTRLWAIALFVANEMQWDPMVQMLANSLAVAIACGAAMVWSLKNVSKPEFVVVGIGLVMAAIIPNGWENTLGGFQSPFYFVDIFSVLAIGTATIASGRVAGAALLTTICVAALFSLATGSFAALAVIFVVVTRVWVQQLTVRVALRLAIPCLVVFVVGIIITPHIPYHEVYRPTSLGEFLRGLSIALSWPLNSAWGMLVWTPFVVWAMQTIRRRAASSADLLFGGLAVWGLLVCAGIAISRGHDMTDVASRYTDTIVFALLANGYFLVGQISRFVGQRKRFMILPAAFVLLAAMTSALALQYIDRRPGIIQRSGMMQIAASNVYRYLGGDEHALTGKPPGYVPASSPYWLDALANDLSNPRVVSFLPFSLIPFDHRLEAKRARFCSWSSGVPPSSAGAITCGEQGPAVVEGSASSVSVGPLSALSFGLWKLTRTRWKAPLVSTQLQPGAGNTLRCSLDVVDDQTKAAAWPSIDYPGAIKLQGWVGPRVANESVRLSFVSQDGRVFSATSETSVARPDVSAYLKDEGFAKSGFEMWADGSNVPLGKYRIVVGLGDSENCDTGRALAITSRADPRLAY